MSRVGSLTTLGAVVARTGGVLQTGPFGSQLHAGDYTGTGTPLVMPVNLGDNEIRDRGIARIGAADAHRLRRHALREGDIIFSRRGDVGRRSLVRQGEAGWLCGTGCLAARFGDKRLVVNPAYIAEFVGSSPAQSWLVDNAVGGTMPNLNTSILAALPIWLPSKPEQDRIVAVLDDLAKTTIVLRRQIAKKHAIKQGMMQQLLTGRTRLPGFDETWGEVTVGTLTEQNRHTIDPRQYRTRRFQHFSLPAFDSGEQPVIELGSLIDSVKFLVPPHAVLVSKLNPRIPRIWLPRDISANAVASTEFVVMTPKPGTSRSFIKWLMKSQAITSRMKLLATGTTGSHARIHPRQVAALEARVPPETEQIAIATVLDDAAGEITSLHERLAKTCAVKTGMMQQLLTGRIHLPIEEVKA